MSSIFGDVSQGVPNPVVAHAHPYPTRYHGPNLIQPQATFSYRERPYDSPHQSSVVHFPLAGSSPDGIGVATGETSYSSYTLIAYSLLSIAGTASGAYHGYKRNNSVGWAIGWALLGGIFPFITIPVSLAQGYGEPKGR